MSSDGRLIRHVNELGWTTSMDHFPTKLLCFQNYKNKSIVSDMIRNINTVMEAAVGLLPLRRTNIHIQAILLMNFQLLYIGMWPTDYCQLTEAEKIRSKRWNCVWPFATDRWTNVNKVAWSAQWVGVKFWNLVISVSIIKIRIVKTESSFNQSIKHSINWQTLRNWISWSWKCCWHKTCLTSKIVRTIISG